jgi:NAD(P)H-dependent FMN reductase
VLPHQTTVERQRSSCAYVLRGLAIQMTNPKAALAWIAVMSLGLRHDAPLYIAGIRPFQRPSRGPVAEEDGRVHAYIFTAADYDRGSTAVLKNALDYVYKEWANKPVAFVGYGGVGGARATEQLRLNAIELQMAREGMTARHGMWVTRAANRNRSLLAERRCGVAHILETLCGLLLYR